MKAVTGNFLYDAVLPRIEQICWPIAGLGLVYRYCLLRGNDTMLMVALGTLATVYFLRAFEPSDELAETGPPLNFNYEPVVTTPNLLQQFQGISSGGPLMGILFKLLFWEGATMSLLLSVPIVVTVVAWRLANGSLTRPAIVIAGLRISAWAYPTEIMVRQFYRDDPDLVEKTLYQVQHPNDRAATAEVHRLLQKRRKRHLK
ncbi:hypothetical protein QMK33_17590 [Hymenobacter sp. H14-R3]|uniref:hypothetical protein n=1 Tax=Hymenobacter sp. H14-R3 TaxID=3046308 RepID=UPI0024BA4DC3|nr:hypothetical protein [Hymenobacter sp. H14-R3]MDJ0366967.1 hypothetical protein [Hymenobacter sp. H14-R3]